MIRSGVTIALLALLILGACAALAFGEVPLSPAAVFGALVRGDGVVETVIVREIRLPRMVLGVLAGFSLGVAGAALQGLLRNPLADPGVLGVTSTAGLGAVLAIYYGVAAITTWAIPVSAMLGAAIATLVLVALARRGSTVLTLILVGVGISGLAAALTSLAINLAPNPFMVSDIVLWLLGSLANRDWDDVFLVLPFVVIGCGLMLSTGNSLQALTLGEEVANSLRAGVDVARVPIILGCALAVGSVVAVCGSIGFVGLIVPHLVRPLVAHHPRALLLPSGLAGALLVVLADTVTRVAPTTQTIRLGVVTALVGTPFFLYLVLRERRRQV